MFSLFFYTACLKITIPEPPLPPVLDVPLAPPPPEPVFAWAETPAEFTGPPAPPPLFD
jgi:hypothetical protein